MFTLNKLNKILTEFVEKHRQLKTFRLENVGDFSNIEYPLLAGLIQPSPIDNVKDSTVIRFFIQDRVSKGLRNQIDCLSDTKLMCLDLLSYFKQTDFEELGYLDIVQSTTLEPTVEGADDEISGWTFEVTFNTIFEWDLCSVPVTN